MVVYKRDPSKCHSVSPTLYRAAVGSELDYGCTVYGAVSMGILQNLDTIHHRGLRIALGAFRTSVTSLYSKALEMSLKNRRKKLSMNYVLKLKTFPNNPAYSCGY